MPLRKRHVRRSVALGLGVLVLGGLGWLAVWGVWLQGGGYDHDVAAALKARLRCRTVTVTGARPTGLDVAEATKVSLEWEAAGGRLVFDLDGVSAQSGGESKAWDVAAATGTLRLEGPRPMETLAALNQRLVQDEGATALGHLRVGTLAWTLEPDRLAASDYVTAEATAEEDGRMVVRMRRRGDVAVTPATRAAPGEKPEIVLSLRPTSPEGIFGGLTIDVRRFPASRIVLKGAAAPPAQVKGLIGVSVDWPADPGEAAFLELSARGLTLADWTSTIPGGPAAGTADLDVLYRRPPNKPAEWEVLFNLRNGRLTVDTLRWMEGLPGGLHAAAAQHTEAMKFGVLSGGLRSIGAAAHFTGKTDPFGHVVLTSGRLFGRLLPLVWAPTTPFDGAAFKDAILEPIAPAAK